MGKKEYKKGTSAWKSTSFWRRSQTNPLLNVDWGRSLDSAMLSCPTCVPVKCMAISLLG